MVEGRKQLADWIKRSKLQKQEAAQLIGISAGFLSHLLGGHRLPTLPSAVNIEEATGIPVASWAPRRRGKAVRAVKPQPNSASLA